MSSSYSRVLWARGPDRLKFILNIWNTKSVNDRSMKSSSGSMARSWILRMACSSNLNTSSVECMVGSPGTHSQVKFFEKVLWDRIIVESIFLSCLRSWFFGHLLNLSDQRCITEVRPKGPIFLVSKGAMHLLENENHKFNGHWGVLVPITPPPHCIISFCLLQNPAWFVKFQVFIVIYSGVYTNLLVFLKDL